MGIVLGKICDMHEGRERGGQKDNWFFFTLSFLHIIKILICNMYTCRQSNLLKCHCFLLQL